jgi:hypothetical protein
MECTYQGVGSTNPEIAGIGVSLLNRSSIVTYILPVKIIISFAVQAGLSVIISSSAFVLVFSASWVTDEFAFKVGSSIARRIEERRQAQLRLFRNLFALEAMKSVLRAISDIQTFNGWFTVC